MTTFLPWVRKLDEVFPEMSEVPLFGRAPSFDIDALAALLASRLEAQHFALRIREQAWKEENALEEGLGEAPLIAAVFFIPLGVPLYFAMPRADMDKFTAWIMHQPKTLRISEPLKEGFFRFLLLEVLDAAQSVDPLQKFTLQLMEEPKLPRERAFVIELEISLLDSSCWSRLLIPATFQKKWVEHFAQDTLEYGPNKLSSSAEMLVGLKISSISMKRDEWASLRIGDCLALDPGGYDLREQAGIATLFLESIPLFQVKIHRNKIELLDFGLIQEEPMEDNDQEKENKENESVDTAEESAVSIKDVPFNVCVELARIKISLDRLMHLQPGNVLELPIHPDQGVFLTIQGKKVGRAELVYLGEALAIRILELA